MACLLEGLIFRLRSHRTAPAGSKRPGPATRARLETTPWQRRRCASGSARVHGDAARPGFFGFGNAQPEHAVVELRFDLARIQLAAQGKAAAVLRVVNFAVEKLHLAGDRR